MQLATHVYVTGRLRIRLNAAELKFSISFTFYLFFRLSQPTSKIHRGMALARNDSVQYTAPSRDSGIFPVDLLPSYAVKVTET